MARPKGSKKVVCKCKQVNFLKPGRSRKCSGKKCTRMLVGPKSR